MIGLIIQALIASLKDRLLVAFATLEASLTALLTPLVSAFLAPAQLASILHPIVAHVTQMITEVLDQIDVAELEQELLGRVVELAKTGRSQASHDPGIDVG